MLWEESVGGKELSWVYACPFSKVSNSALSFGIFFDVVYHFTQLGKDFPSWERTKIRKGNPLGL